MAALTESDIITNAYYILEKGNSPWTSGSDEYATAKGLANIAVGRWENYDNTVWNELWGTLTDASDGTKTLTKGTYSYACPTNMARPSSYVRSRDTGGTSTYWQVVTVGEAGNFDNSTYHYCYFTGSIKSGFTLHFNPNITLTTGDTILYEYYKQATKFSGTTTTTEMSDPYFISYFIAAHMVEDGVDPDLNNLAEARLEDMRVKNMSQLFGVSSKIPEALDFNNGFGY